MWGRPGPGNGRGGGLPRGADGPPEGAGPGPPGGPAAAATLDASRALPVDRPSCGGRRGRARGARRVPARPPHSSVRSRSPPPLPPSPPSPACFGGRAGGCGERAGGPGSPGGAAVRAGLPPPGPPPGPRFRAAPRLGRRLAADLELVRTRGIRLFN